jgi:signal transduction histidine kinase
VIGFSDTLLRDRGGTDPAVVREYAEEINNAGKRLLLLINTILDISRIEAGRYDLATDRVDFARLAAMVLRQNRAAALAGEIELINEMPTDLPLLRGDERRMQQVLGHLISNAVKFSDAGGRTAVSARIDENGDLLVRVSDTGIGIAQENLDRVFEPFTQIDSGLERRYEGTGLSLYISRAVVEAHGGTLTLRSELGKGTTVEIRLPAARVIPQHERGRPNRQGQVTRLASD